MGCSIYEGTPGYSFTLQCVLEGFFLFFFFFFFFFKDDNAFYESNNYLCFTWQEQITQIKSDLLSVVNKEVQTLKETISKLTEENQELKQENEKLRNLVVNRKTST